MSRNLSAYIIEIFNDHYEIVESFTVYAHNWKEARNKANGQRTKDGRVSVKKEDTMEVKE